MVGGILQIDGCSGRMKYKPKSELRFVCVVCTWRRVSTGKQIARQDRKTFCRRERRNPWKCAPQRIRFLGRAIVFPMRHVARDAVTRRSVRSLEQKFARPLFYEASKRSGKWVDECDDKHRWAPKHQAAIVPTANEN